MLLRRGLGSIVVVLLVAGVLAGNVKAEAQAAERPQAAPAAGDTATVDPAQRDRVLPAGWRSSADLAMTTSGDASGFHLLVAESRTGYTWRTAASLAEPGLETDQWIGNACLTGSGRRAVVVYAPRTFTNRAELFDRGAFAAVVDLANGNVTKLPIQVSIAYFDPGCGTGETAVITQAGDVEFGKTRLHLVDAAAGRIADTVTVPGQVTSAVPAAGGMVAARGPRLIGIGRGGAVRNLATTSGPASEIHPDAAGGVAFSDRTGATMRVRHLQGGSVRTVASGPVGDLGVAAGAAGRLFLTGSPRQVAALPNGMRRLQAPASAEPSSLGDLAVTGAVAAHLRAPGSGQGLPTEPDVAEPVTIQALVTGSGQPVGFEVDPAARPAARAEEGREASPAMDLTAAAAAGSPTDPVEAERTCSVPRNDSRTQVYQPHWHQVEWAADLAVQGALTFSRPANWKQSGLPAWTPGSMFPAPALAGGGRAPAQVLLGILAQESNLWQASFHALEGVTGNPLIGNYYGLPIYDATTANDWDIDWAKSDCGYGVGQITEGMRLIGPNRFTANQQRAIAVDYASNIAAALMILYEKWNETYNAGLKINNANPLRLENWFYAVWAYNSGFHANPGGGQPWGVGWSNNPINPKYDQFRPPFLELTYADAATPQRWPYPEKVMGWAAYPISKDGGNDHGYAQAWWTSNLNRTEVKPPLGQFCDATNACYPGQTFPNNLNEPPGPCSRSDLQCWYNRPSTWKPDCEQTCGRETIRYSPGAADPGDAANYPPNCSVGGNPAVNANGLPSGALIIDDVPTSVPSVRPGCTKSWTNSGTFGLSFGGTGGLYQSKIDFHQIGAGFGAHFWFAHTRVSPTWDKLKVTGTWTLNQQINGWARVMVHMPDHGAHTQEATYKVNLGNGTSKNRSLFQRTLQNRWVPLGAFQFAGTPSVSLSTVTDRGDGSEDVAWDAVAFQRLSAKPRNQVVVLGDSYASGEGASVTGGGDYYKETDNNGGNAYRNACHQSQYAWSRKAFLNDTPSKTIGARADEWDPSMDYQMVACAGAQTEHLLSSGGRALPGEPTSNAFGEPASRQFRAMSQLDRGFLDASTTLVLLSIGGNDARFTKVVEQCVYASGLSLCQDSTLSGDSQPLKVREPQIIDNEVKASIKNVLSAVHVRAPNAKIALMGYPLLLENQGQCVPGIGTSEAPWMNQMGDRLALRMGEAATESGTWVRFSDPRTNFAGKAICGTPEEMVHGIVVDKTPGDLPTTQQPPSAQSFHPKITGTTLYANRLNTTLRSMGL
jgi:hypothetical protein